MTEPSQAHGLELLHQMVLIRRFEDACAELYGLLKIRGFLHLYNGEEAAAVGLHHAMRPTDDLVATYREHGHALLRGTPPGAVMAEMYGKAHGCSHGRGGSMHLFDAAHHLHGGHAIVGGGLPIAVGLALAHKQLGRDAVVVAVFGDGATDEGEFHESLNLAALWSLPVLFFCENNQYAMGTALDRHQAVTDLSAKPAAAGIASERTDGMDVDAVEQAATRAIERVRSTSKPAFLEASTYRFRAHSMFDAELYRGRAEVESWKRDRDPIELHAARLVARGWLDDRARASIEARAAADVASAVAFAEGDVWEPVADLTRHVVSDDDYPVGLLKRGAP